MAAADTCVCNEKIIHQIGLCICFYDLLSASDGLISANNSGPVNVKATFRLIIFRPFKGEIIEAKISSSSEKGIHLHTEFFSDIFIPGPQNLFPNSTFDETEQVWIWTSAPEPNDEADADASQPQPQQYYFDKHELVRFRVEEEVWTELAPGDEDGYGYGYGGAGPGRLGPMQQGISRRSVLAVGEGEGSLGVGARGGARDEVGTGRGRSVEDGMVGAGAGAGAGRTGGLRAWRLVGSMQQAGLGLCGWWEGDAEAEAGMQEGM